MGQLNNEFRKEFFNKIEKNADIIFFKELESNLPVVSHFVLKKELRFKLFKEINIELLRENNIIIKRKL